MANSLIGSVVDDRVGNIGITALNNGYFVASSSQWNNGAVLQAGAVTWFSWTLSAGNSVLGTVANQGASMSFDFDPLRAQLVVGRPASNLVSLLAEVISCSSFE